jgi:hypothetical protein
MSGHTPGPWLMEPYLDKPGEYEIAPAGADGLPDWSREVALTCSSDADARLIAAAPELLAALRDLVAMSGCSEEGVDIWDAARAAIAKAEGR